MEENRIVIQGDDGSDIELFVLEETRINGMNYILTTDAPEGEDGECYVLKDMSRAEDPDAVYQFVEDEAEMNYMFKIFTELMADSDTELVP